MTTTPYQPVIQVIVLKDQEYLIAGIEEREESPECLLTNPYRITDLTYWDHSNVDYKSVRNPNALFVEESEEKEIDKDGNEVTVIQADYILLQKFPKYSNQTQIYLRADDILTICDPSFSVLEYYQKTVG
jgi:hypothetical protein